VNHLLPDQLRYMARTHPNEVGFRTIDIDERLTFTEWEALSNRLARGLVASGVRKGDRVVLRTYPEEAVAWVVAYAAIHKAGAVNVPLSHRLTEPEVDAITTHAEAVAAITVPFGDLLDEDASEFQVPTEGDDLADILYTSGTTGTPKGVVVRHRDAPAIPYTEPKWMGRAWINASPLFTFSGINSVYNPMKLGLSSWYMARFDAGSWFDIIERHAPMCAFIVPAMAELIVKHPRFAAADLSALKLVSIGSAPLSTDTLRALQERLPGANVSNGYGMTEAGPAYCYMPAEESRRRVGSVGRPMPPMELRIVDEQNRDLPAGEVGEILMRLPGRQREYFRNPEATAHTWEGGWLRSGDLGRVDEDGFLYVVGRKKDMIIRGGNNVYPADVEAALQQHPAVVEAAVVGVPHDVLGEDIAAFVVADGVTADDLIAFCRQRLAGDKVPRHLAFMSELPRNPTGKVQKHLLPRDELERA
jgi:acyl-CoA synthetase (AMP-forming)/AMP-acid ligase II